MTVVVSPACGGRSGISVSWVSDTGQALVARLVDELTLIVAPVVLGAGKRYSMASANRSSSSTLGSASRRSPPSSTTGSRLGGAERSAGRLIYRAFASLDGYVEDRQGRFDWAEDS